MTDIIVHKDIVSRFKKHPKALKVILDILQDHPTYAIEIEHWGSGDSGEVSTVYISNGKESQYILGEKARYIDEWAWDECSDRYPGYEINDGGGLNAKFYLRDNHLIYTWDTFYNEMITDTHKCGVIGLDKASPEVT